MSIVLDKQTTCGIGIRSYSGAESRRDSQMRVVGNRRDGRGFTCRKVNGLSDNQLSLEQRACSRNAVVEVFAIPVPVVVLLSLVAFSALSLIARTTLRLLEYARNAAAENQYWKLFASGSPN